MLDTGRIENNEVRRSQRVLAMVHELHKQGYQRLAIFSGMAPSGAYWRCQVLPYDSIFRSPDNVLKVYASDGVEVAEYSSGESNNYFGWTDAKSDTARQLAGKFVERFPRLSTAGLGECFPYSGWFNLMLGRSERGDLPVMFSDDGLDGTDCRGSETGLPISLPPHHTSRIQNGILLSRQSISRQFVEENDWHTAYQPLVDKMGQDLRKGTPVIAPQYPLPHDVNRDNSYHDLLFQVGAYWEGAIYYLITILRYDSPEHFLSDYLTENLSKGKEWDLFKIIWDDRGQLSLLLAYFCRIVLQENYLPGQDHMGVARKEQVARWLQDFETSHERPLLYPNPYYGGGNPLHLGCVNARFCN
ncbi:hypothetical protein H2508_01425 [Parahaliea sp. F7430]|uniref:Uncharacterized protein n=1 Tax=Sediminihaliea albiluteola TaxID=2758564 RepID=A0A7W2YIZ6_9GAMM|nr:hypothetical protein [Sediminihaliea albiluteola]MBA6411768.1 hypothetical protein [Sediminihaliea albiluteola]